MQIKKSLTINLLLSLSLSIIGLQVKADTLEECAQRDISILGDAKAIDFQTMGKQGTIKYKVKHTLAGNVIWKEVVKFCDLRTDEEKANDIAEERQREKNAKIAAKKRSAEMKARKVAAEAAAIEERKAREITRKANAKEKAKRDIEAAYQHSIKSCEKSTYPKLLQIIKKDTGSLGTSTKTYNLKAERPKNYT